MIIMLKVNTQCPQWSISSLESYACDLINLLNMLVCQSS